MMTLRDEQKARTKARLVTAAKALWAEAPYEAVSVRDIARKAGFSTGAIFSLWSGKADLYKEVMGREPADSVTLAAEVCRLSGALRECQVIAADGIDLTHEGTEANTLFIAIHATAAGALMSQEPPEAPGAAVAA